MIRPSQFYWLIATIFSSFLIGTWDPSFAQENQPVQYIRFADGQTTERGLKQLTPSPIDHSMKQSAPKEAGRSLRVLVVVDQHFHAYWATSDNRDLWKFSAGERVKAASAALDKELHLRLEVADVVPWFGIPGEPGAAPAQDLLKVFRNAFPTDELNRQGVDVAILLSWPYSDKEDSKPSAPVEQETESTPKIITVGLTYPFSRALIVREQSSSDLPATIVHEVSHLFGADESDDPNSFMCTREFAKQCNHFESGMLTFDEVNREIIALMRDKIDFRSDALDLDDATIAEYSNLVRRLPPMKNPLISKFTGDGWKALGSDNLEGAKNMFRKASVADPDDPRTKNAWSEFFLRRGNAAKSAKNFNAALLYYQSAATLAPKDCYAHVYVGDAFRTLGDPTRAREEYRSARENDSSESCQKLVEQYERRL